MLENSSWDDKSRDERHTQTDKVTENREKKKKQINMVEDGGSEEQQKSIEIKVQAIRYEANSKREI